MNDRPTEWVPAAQALAVLIQAYGADRGIGLLLDRGRCGIISGRADVLSYASRTENWLSEGHDVPAALWLWIAENAIAVSWETGDFDLRGYKPGVGWLDVYIRGLRISMEPIRRLASEAISPTQALGNDPGLKPEDGASESLAKTGVAGRPTSMHLIEAMFEKRAEGEMVCKTLAEEARVLRRYFISNPEFARHPRPTAKTIENNLRGRYRALKPIPPKYPPK